MKPEATFGLDYAMKMLYRDSVPRETVEKVGRYIENNLEVWQRFEKYTLEAIEREVVVGAKAVAERIRWDGYFIDGDGFKVSNTYIAYLARIFMYKYPMHI